MKTKINLIHKKPYGIMYDLYLDNKKVNPKKEIELNENSTLYLIEQNLVLCKFWWLLFIFDFIGRFFGCDMSLEECKDKQNIIPIKLKGKISDKIDITVTENAAEILISGQEDYEIGQIIEKDRPEVKKRVKAYKRIVISAILTILFIIAIIVFVAIKNKG